MKLASFIAGSFGSVGFGISVLAGLTASNSVESILTNGLLSAVVCFVVGYVVGIIAQQVSKEHAAHIAKVVSDADAKARQEADDAAAALEAEQADAQTGATTV